MVEVRFAIPLRPKILCRRDPRLFWPCQGYDRDLGSADSGVEGSVSQVIVPCYKSTPPRIDPRTRTHFCWKIFLSTSIAVVQFRYLVTRCPPIYGTTHASIQAFHIRY